MARFHRITPLIPAGKLAGSNISNVYLKLDNLQPSGSFKDRGISHMISELMKTNNVEKLISSSGGNAGHSVATVGQFVGLPVDVYVPVTTKDMMVTKLKSKGANVVVHGANWNAADKLARQAVEDESGAFYIPPYDHPLLWDGHSTIIDELAESGVHPGAIVLSVGGGGLLCGVQKGLERHGWTDVNVYACETEGAASYAAAHANGAPVALEAITSIATSLGALAVTDATLRTPVKTQPVVVSDRDAVEALLRFADEHRMLVEPACGASLAALRSSEVRSRIESELGDRKDVVVVVCGGSIVSLELLAQWKEQFQC